MIYFPFFSSLYDLFIKLYIYIPFFYDLFIMLYIVIFYMIYMYCYIARMNYI